MRMDKRNNDGFTLVEILLVMVIITFISGLFIAPAIVQKETVILNAVDSQLKAMATGQRVSFKDGLHFNHRGNINQAKTLQINGKRCVFQLGMGRYYCE